MTAKTSHRLEYVGWLFWFILFLVLLGPCIYGLHRVAYREQAWTASFGLGSIGAAVGAGFISWIVNATLQARARKHRLAERKVKKKKK